MNVLRLLATAVVLSLAVDAMAADPPKKEEDAGLAGQAVRPKVNEVERGLWFSMEAAPLTHIEWVSRLPPQNLKYILPDDFGVGYRAGGRVGYDLLRLVSFEGYWLAQFREKRVRRGRSYTGDLSDLTAGVSLRVMPVTIKDRLSIYGRASLGAGFLMPGEVARAYTNPGCLPPAAGTPATDLNPACVALPGVKLPWPVPWQPFPPHVIFVTPAAELMAGVEYFTHLRHFSFGADFVVGAMPWPLQLHAAVVPHVKYTF